MLGRVVRDPDALESSRREVAGLGWLPIETTLASPKRTAWVQGHLAGPWAGVPIKGYEIHMGRTDSIGNAAPLASVRAADEEEWRSDGVMADDMKVIGTYLHGILDNQGFRELWLNHVRQRAGIGPAKSVLSITALRDHAYNRLATAVRGYLRLDLLYASVGLDETSAGNLEEGGHVSLS